MVFRSSSRPEAADFLMYTGGFDVQVAASYFNQLLGALATAHSLGISHRDIKPENILLDAEFQLKLADFGLAAIDHDERLHMTECGTRSYMAPEILAHRAYAGAKADVWSSGVVCSSCLLETASFQQATIDDWWYKAISAGNYDRFWRAHPPQRVPAGRVSRLPCNDSSTSSSSPIRRDALMFVAAAARPVAG